MFDVVFLYQSADPYIFELKKEKSNPMSLTVVVRASTLEEMHHASHTARLALTAIQIGCQPAHFRRSTTPTVSINCRSA